MESLLGPITASQCKDKRCTGEKGMSFHTMLLSRESVDGIEIKTGIKNNHVYLTSAQTTTDWD